jgi:hypothetical protein
LEEKEEKKLFCLVFHQLEQFPLTTQFSRLNWIRQNIQKDARTHTLMTIDGDTTFGIMTFSIMTLRTIDIIAALSINDT